VDSLLNIAENTEPGYRLVYVDGNSPEPVARRLAGICEERGFTYLRTEHYLSPNQARNLALEKTVSLYAAFVDNDLFVQPGWLKNLVSCAEETGAWAVGPVILEGSERLPVVHMTGGDLFEERVGDFNRVRQRHRNMFQTLASVRNELTRGPVGSFEFHCVLLRTDVFQQRKFLDEAFLALQEHLDLAREIRLAGGEVYFEPSSVVRYDNARKFKDYDREYFELRWSESWTSQSIEHTRRKWELGPDDAGLRRLEKWTAKHRGLFEQSQTPWTLHIAPILARRKVGRWLRRHNFLPEAELQ
jgi:GT2 family glycosyltransferase